MTAHIPLSQIESAETFAAAVEAHRQDLIRVQMGEPGEPPVNPVPFLVAQCIVRIPDVGPVAKRKPDEIKADFVIIDDTPPEPPPPTLDERKAKLQVSLVAAANAARAAIMSPAKAQLLTMDAQAVYGIAEDKRTKDDLATIKRFDDYQASLQAITRRAVEIAVEIEDLTDETIGEFQIQF